MSAPIEAAEVVLPCPELAPSLAFFTETLGFRLDAVFPADDPSVAVISGHGVRLRLERGAAAAPGTLRLRCAGAADRELLAPNGTRVVFAGDAPPPLPPLRPELVISRGNDRGPNPAAQRHGAEGSAACHAAEARWGEGRAGMLYRDLIPGRQGGRFIASHIRIPEGGPVPDQVHFHRVRFQIIYCLRGWVRLVYEDQGPPFVLEAGDLVLQPPEIRHRVLEASPGLEVIELASPATHPTLMDHDLALPTGALRPERRFSGQRFVRHRAAAASWEGHRLPGFESRRSGVAEASGGVVGVRAVRRRESAPAADLDHAGELLFFFVCRGEARFRWAEGESRLEVGDALIVPPGLPHALFAESDDLELLEVSSPAL